MPARKVIVLSVFVLIVVAFIFIVLGIRRNNGVENNRISGNGIVEATEVEVSSKIPGRIVSLEVREGENVTKGQLIALLEDGDIKGQAEQAGGKLAAAQAVLAELKAGTRPEDIMRLQAQLDAARMGLQQARARRDLIRAGARKEQINQLRAVLSQARIMLDDAETELARARKLEQQGAIPGRDLDQAGTRRDAANAQAETARQRLAEVEAGARPEEIKEAESAVAQAEAYVEAARAIFESARSGPRKETIAAAEGQVAQARGTLKSAEYLLGEASIHSPIDGTVTQRNSENGEVITPGFPIIRLSNLEKVFLRVYVPEAQVGRLKLGQKSEVVTDTYPGKRYAGTVVEIAEKPEFTPKNVQTREERVKLVFGVKIAVDNREQELKPGMPADAVILVGQ